MVKIIRGYSSNILIIFIMVMVFAFPARGQISSVQKEGPGIRLSVAYHPRFTRSEIAYESNVLWRNSSIRHPLELRVETSIAYWHTNHTTHMSKSHSILWQIGITPMLRYHLNNRWFLEGGIGPTLISHTRFLNKEVSTKFQFGDHLGIGYYANDNWRVGVRFSHFSNGSIKKPNPGFNMLHFSISRSF